MEGVSNNSCLQEVLRLKIIFIIFVCYHHNELMTIFFLTLGYSLLVSSGPKNKGGRVIGGACCLQIPKAFMLEKWRLRSWDACCVKNPPESAGTVINFVEGVYVWFSWEFDRCFSWWHWWPRVYNRLNLVLVCWLVLCFKLESIYNLFHLIFWHCLTCCIYSGQLVYFGTFIRKIFVFFTCYFICVFLFPCKVRSCLSSDILQLLCHSKSMNYIFRKLKRIHIVKLYWVITN